MTNEVRGVLGKIKVPTGYPYQGSWARIVAARATELDLHIFRECRSTMRGPVSKVFTVPLSAWVA